MVEADAKLNYFETNITAKGCSIRLQAKRTRAWANTHKQYNLHIIEVIFQIKAILG